MSITSPWISTADIGDWDYYIFTENNGVVQVMNGLAAWFNGAGGGLVQGAALLGGLVLLMYALFGAATRSNKTSPLIIGTWALLVASVGITGKAVVTNVYTGQVAVVANVPALALVPASIFSTAGYRIFEDIDQAYQTTSGSYMTVGQWGFVGPLDVLLSLRSNKAPGLIGPEVYRSLVQVLTDCGTDPENAPPAGTNLENAIDVMAYLAAYGRQSGLTMIYPTATTTTGQIESCGGALDWLNDRFTALATGAPLLKLNAVSVLPNPQGGSGMWGANATNEAFDMLIAGAISSTQDSVQYTKNALVASYVTYSRDCFTSNNAIVNPSECANAALAVGEGLESWKTGAAAGGSGFLKTMFTSMGFMQVMFFSFFPFVIVYAVATGMQAAKVVGGYIFFGIWTQSWVIIVAPIQSYIQNNVIEVVRKTTDGQGLTIGNANALYERLSTQLAVASDMMASAQMMSLALISGSIYAMVGMANKWSGATSMNTNSLQKDLVKEGAIMAETPMQKMQLMGSPQGGQYNQGDGQGYVEQNGVTNYSGSTNRTTTDAATSGSSKERSTSENLTQSIKADMGTSMGSSVKSDQVDKAAERSNAAYKVMAGLSPALFGGLAAAGMFNGMSKEQRAATESQISSQANAAFAAQEEKSPGWFKSFVAGNADAVEKGIDIASGVAMAAGVAGATLTTGGAGAVPAALGANAVRQAVSQGAKQWVKNTAQGARQNIATAAARPGLGGKALIGATAVGEVMGGISKGVKAGADAVFGSELSKEFAASTSVSQDEQNKLAVDATQAAAKTNVFSQGQSYSESQGAVLANQQAFVNDRNAMASQFMNNPSDMTSLRTQASEIAVQAGNSVEHQGAMRVVNDAMRGASSTNATVNQAMRDAVYINEMQSRLELAGTGAGGSSANNVAGAAPAGASPSGNSGIGSGGMTIEAPSANSSSQIGGNSLGTGFDGVAQRAADTHGEFAKDLTGVDAKNENRVTSGEFIANVDERTKNIENITKTGVGVAGAADVLGGLSNLGGGKGGRK